MLGILGAHLLLLDPQPDEDLFQVVIQNLRSLLIAPINYGELHTYVIGSDEHRAITQQDISPPVEEAQGYTGFRLP
jgi:hypothetical protein